MGGVITNTVQDRGARCRSSVVPPLPDGDGGVTDRATRGAWSAGSGWAEQYLTSSMGEPQNPSRQPVTPRHVWVRTTAGMEASCFHLRDTAPHHLYQSAGDCVGACGACGAGEGRAAGFLSFFFIRAEVKVTRGCTELNTHDPSPLRLALIPSDPVHSSTPRSHPFRLPACPPLQSSVTPPPL